MHKITKLKAVDNPLVSTAETHDDYRASVENSLFKVFDDHLSPNVNYWTIGEIVIPPQVGLSVVMHRWVRNGEMIRGTFTTSPVKKITESGFETLNSVYLIEEVDDETILEYSLNTSGPCSP